MIWLMLYQNTVKLAQMLAIWSQQQTNWKAFLIHLQGSWVYLFYICKYAHLLVKLHLHLVSFLQMFEPLSEQTCCLFLCCEPPVENNGMN